MPATVRQLKEWTDKGIPIMIAWNPEGRPWSHASVVFDVDDDLNVHVADPNIPDPDETVRIVSKTDFYGKWYEKAPNYLIRRPAMAVEREVTPEGRQVVAKTVMKVKTPKVKPRDPFVRERAGKPGGGAGKHHNRERDVAKGRSRKRKHKKDFSREGAGKPPSGTHMKSLAWIDDGVTGQGWVLTDQTTGHIVGKPQGGFTPDSPFRGSSPGARDYRAGDPVEWLPKAQSWGSRVKAASTGQDCHFWEATDGKWYMMLESPEYQGEYDNYGPFSSYTEADRFLRRNFANPGHSSQDPSGSVPPPRDPINPRGRRMWASGHGKAASRPGPHWNPWPQSDGSDLEGEIQLLGIQVRFPDMFDPHLELAQYERPGDKDKALRVLPKLIKALKSGDRRAAKRWAEAIPKAYSGIVGNPVWTFILDGRTAGAGRSLFARIDTKDMDRAANLLNYMSEKDALKQLIESGMSRQDAFLAVKAGKILNEDRTRRKAAALDWKGTAQKLLDRAKGTTQDDLHYRAYLRAVVMGQPPGHLVKKFKGAEKARADLIDEAGKGRLAVDKRAAPLRLGPGKPHRKFTEMLVKVKPRARSWGDFNGAMLQAAFYAKKQNKTMFIYAGTSFGTGVWRVSDKPDEYLNFINNTGSVVFSVSPTLEVTEYPVEGRPSFGKEAKALTEVWVVRDPGTESTWADIIYKSSVRDLAKYLVGTGVPLWAKENSSLHDDAKSAEADAYKRLQRIHGRQVPEWVFGSDRPWTLKVAAYSGNPDGSSIYPADIDHGYGEPLAGGTDVMRKLQNQLLHEQGNDEWRRPESPKLAVSRDDSYFVLPLLGVSPSDIAGKARTAQRLIGSEWKVTPSQTVGDVQTLHIGPKKWHPDWVADFAVPLRTLLQKLPDRTTQLNMGLIRQLNREIIQALQVGRTAKARRLAARHLAKKDAQ